MKALTPVFQTIRPLRAPSATPVAMAASTARVRLYSCRPTESDAASPRVAPTERSMLPLIIT